MADLLTLLALAWFVYAIRAEGKRGEKPKRKAGGRRDGP